jgi:radical SAM superfamily enzyme YgiQ (UPF0313 family)
LKNAASDIFFNLKYPPLFLQRKELRNMKILLVYPQYPDTFWSFKYAVQFVSKKASMPPLGLLTIASMMPRDWDKKLIDTNVEKLRDKDIEWADMVFISAMIVQKKNAQDIINKCNELEKIVVAGGPLFTTQPEKFTGVDHFVLGEGEITLPLFLKDLKQGTPKPMYTSSERPDITSTPIPEWSLLNFSDYATIPIQYSRGCPHNCEFCDIVIMNGRIPRTKSPEQMVDECQSLYDAGWRGSTFIVDDNFIGNKKKVKEMLPSLITWQKAHNYPFQLLTEATTTLADDSELVQLMSDANFSKVFLGIETPCEESLKECGKNQNIAGNIVDAIKKLNQKGMQVMGGFIVGFDNDTEDIFERQIKFIQQLGVVTAMVGILTALPKTQLWKRLKNENRLLSDTTGGNTDGNINFIPKMGKEKLIEGYKKILSTIYSPKYYYERVNTFIENYKPTVKGKITKEDLSAFFKSMWKIGIFSDARFQYWKLMAKTWFKKPSAFPIAVELAIFGFHFEKVTKKVLSSNVVRAK